MNIIIGSATHVVVLNCCFNAHPLIGYLVLCVCIDMCMDRCVCVCVCVCVWWGRGVGVL